MDSFNLELVLTEAPKDTGNPAPGTADSELDKPDATPPTEEAPADGDTSPEEDTPPEEPTPETPPTDDGVTDPANDADNQAGIDADESDMAPEDNDPAGDALAQVQEEMRRTELYDSIEANSNDCKSLIATIDKMLTVVKDPKAITICVTMRSKMEKLYDESEVIRTRFNDFGYDVALRVYATARERVSAVGEIIKQIIDSDADFVQQ